MTYGYMRNASALYQQNSIAGGVEGADSHRLIGMLLDGAIDRINQASSFIAYGNVQAKGDAISRVVAIVAELRSSLNHEADPALSQRLESLYEYVTRRLLHAQLSDDRAALAECARLLTPVRDAWQGIRDQYLASTPAAAVAP